MPNSFYPSRAYSGIPNGANVAPTIQNACNIPLNFQQGTIPDISGALKDWYQTIAFTQITKTVVGFQVEETILQTPFRGVIFPLTGRQLSLLPEGQRAWSWYEMYSDPVLTLQVDDVVGWNQVPTRVMGRKNYELYGIVYYTLVQDWFKAGPASP